MKKQIMFGFLTGVLVVEYCILVALLILNMDTFFSSSDNSILAIVLMLILLVISAAITGVLVFGYPAYLFINKKFVEAIYSIAANIITILVIGFMVGVIIFEILKIA